jgi:hypothetical protein
MVMEAAASHHEHPGQFSDRRLVLALIGLVVIIVRHGKSPGGDL